MHEKHVFTFMRINDMGIKQVVKMEYTLLKYINRVWVSGVTMVIEFISGKSWEELKFTSGTIFGKIKTNRCRGVLHERDEMQYDR